MRSRNLKTILPPPIICASLAALLIAACSLIQEMPKEFMDTYGNIAHVEKVEYEGLAEGGGDTPRVTETRDFRIIYTIGNPGDFDLAPEFSFEGGDAEVKKIETEKRRVSLTVSGASLGTLEDGAALKVRLLLYMASQKILQSAYEIDMLYVRTGPPAGADPSNPGGSGGSQGGVDPSDPEPEEPVPPGNTVYVRGRGAAWYESEMPGAKAGDDENSGDEDAPFATVQRAVDEILARNDGKSRYEILIDGTLEGDRGAGENGMADFSALDKDLTLTIKGLSETATLDAGASFTVDDSGSVTMINEGIKKRVIYAAPEEGCALNLTLENLTITGGNSDSDGGGIYASGGTLTIKDGVTIAGNNASRNGGGVDVVGGAFNMKDGTVRGNAAKNGGGVFVYTGGEFNMTGGSVSGNNASGNGGGVDGDGAMITIQDGIIITGNTADFGGGVFVASSTTLNINGGDISKNEARYGGGVYVYTNSSFNMKEGKVNENTATSGGGGVFVNEATFTMSGGDVSKNNAKNAGGVYVNNGSTLNMNGGSISKNNTSSYGGGVCVNNNSTLNMSAGSISGNNASSFGGGVYVSFSSSTLTNTGTKFTMQGGEVSGNTADYKGGGVYVNDSNSTFNMSGSAIISGNNTTSTDSLHGGGGVYVNAGTFTLENNATISENTAIYGGGGVYVANSDSTFTMTGGTIEKNTANFGGGVMTQSSSTFNMSGNSAIKDNNATNTKGGGIYVYYNTKFNMSGDAKVSQENDVYLGSSSTIATITIAGSLTEGIHAKITPSSYAEKRQVLSVPSGAVTAAQCKQFTVSPDGDTNWTITTSSDDKEGYGVLAKANASGDVGVDVPEYDGYEFEVRDNENPEIVEKDTEKITLKGNYPIRLISVTKGENSLTGTFTLEIRDSAGNTLSREGSLCSKTNTSLPIEVQVPTVLVKMEAQVYVEAKLNDGKRINKTYQVTIVP